jgi:hypothetical protein
MNHIEVGDVIHTVMETWTKEITEMVQERKSQEI